MKNPEIPTSGDAPKGLQRIPLEVQIAALVGGPVFMLLSLGALFWAQGHGGLAPNTATGQIYEVCIGRAGCTPRYLTIQEFSGFLLALAPVAVFATMWFVLVVIGVALRLVKR